MALLEYSALVVRIRSPEPSGTAWKAMSQARVALSAKAISLSCAPSRRAIEA